jgi:hypothetical protein
MRIENSFPKPPKFFAPKIPILCSQRNKNKVVIQEYSDTLKNKRDMEIKEIWRYRSRSRCNAPRPTFVYVFQTARLLRV